MNDIANLQQAVDAARAACARASEQQSRSRKHAMSLVRIVEDQLREKRVELSQNEIQRARMIRDYGQLRQMLHALVMTVEVGGSDHATHGPLEIEAEPEAVAALGPRAVVIGPEEAPAEDAAAAEPKPQQRTRAKAEAAPDAAEAGSDEIRAGLKRMLKKKRPPAGETAESGADTPQAPAPAE